MANYRYNRGLDGVREGTVRKLDKDEAAPLIKSGAVTETDDPVSEPQAPADDGEDKTITSDSMGGTREVVTPPRAARGRAGTH